MELTPLCSPIVHRVPSDSWDCRNLSSWFGAAVRHSTPSMRVVLCGSFLSSVCCIESIQWDITNQTDGLELNSHDQELSDDLCVRLYYYGTHSLKLRQSLNCQNGPHNPDVAEAGALSRVVHVGVLSD